MRSRGFTLVEVVSVLALGALLVALVAPRLVELVRSARLAGAARAVAAALRAARGRAIAGAGPVEVRFDAAGAACEARDRTGAWLETRRLPGGVAFAALPARARVLFGTLGTAENATVTLAAGARVRRVIVNQRGRVRVQ
jgi:type IV fimbrial biogenesis protein FimT